jgi:rhamnogalacturonan endolyase
MIHGTHYQAVSKDAFADGKTWGPWLWYLNDGSKEDAARRAQKEERAWPYDWFSDAAYQSRGAVEGRLVLSDGRPAAGAAVFLGDNRSNVSALDQGKDYYYTTYADENGEFAIEDVRTGTYALQAWSNGGKIADVSTTLVQNDIVVRKDKKTRLRTTSWQVSDRKNRIFQVGDFSRTTDGFKLSGPPYYGAGRITQCPANLTCTVGKSRTSDWCFGQSAVGTHSIVFQVGTVPSKATTAKLLVSLAGFSQGSSADILLNAQKIGNISSSVLPNSQDTYRGATRAGEWHLLEYTVQKDALRKGANTLDFTVTSSTQWRGWLWDSIIMEWVP